MYARENTPRGKHHRKRTGVVQTKLDALEQQWLLKCPSESCRKVEDTYGRFNSQFYNIRETHEVILRMLSSVGRNGGWSKKLDCATIVCSLRLSEAGMWAPSEVPSVWL